MLRVVVVEAVGPRSVGSVATVRRVNGGIWTSWNGFPML